MFLLLFFKTRRYIELKYNLKEALALPTDTPSARAAPNQESKA